MRYLILDLFSNINIVFKKNGRSMERTTEGRETSTRGMSVLRGES